MMYGFVGSGKTTYAERLEREVGAVRFTLDEWMSRLYGVAPPTGKFQEYTDRITELIWDVATRLLALGQDVILDFGFWSRASRNDARSRAEREGADAQLYFIKCSEEVMRRRVLERTDELPPGTLWINEAAFELFKARFEPLGEDEVHILLETDAEPMAPADEENPRH